MCWPQMISILTSEQVPNSLFCASQGLNALVFVEMQSQAASNLTLATDDQFDDVLADALALISMVAQDASSLQEEQTPNTLDEFRASLADPELDATLLGLQEM
eukprot:m.143961 g.143961  ORF g.143961 m.143961 type:complete len:103 (-) comp16181_c0_seq4:46-354(-)